MEHVIYTSDLTEVKLQVNRVKRIIASMAKSHWHIVHQNIVQKDSKLDLFCRLKSEFGMSPYLSSPIPSKSEIAISKFRLSSHNLPVETMRYLGLQRYQRLCPFCSTGVGDETHYFTECDHPFFTKLRADFRSSLKGSDSVDVNRCKSEEMISFLNSPNPKILKPLGTFVFSIMEFFKELNTVG